jgi:hypothetical protein
MPPQPSDDPDSAEGKKSFGNISEHHWSRARKDQNQEALDYYRERSKAPGVAEGGGPRNFYCMRCDGVIPSDALLTACPHCGEPLDEHVKRYFNWVEINEPPSGDARAVLKPVLIAVLMVAALVALWSWFA